MNLDARAVDEQLRRHAFEPGEASKDGSPTPRPAQRRKRLQSVFFGPQTCSGQSPRRPPPFNAWTMPQSPRRSSTRGIPRVSCGRSGPIRARRSSENQKKSAIHRASSIEAAESQPNPRCVSRLWVRTLVTAPFIVAPPHAYSGSSAPKRSFYCPCRLWHRLLLNFLGFLGNDTKRFGFRQIPPE